MLHGFHINFYDFGLPFSLLTVQMQDDYLKCYSTNAFERLF